MGVKQSVQIQTPPFNPLEWQPIQTGDVPEEYGMFRTLRNVKTGEKIDQYDFLWPSEEEYLYYLKSFNWRHRQANVVNTRFIELSNHQEICSHSYMAKIYIEHVKIRISQISDIPYPDNLYVLMESLQGFSRIYEHSKYFEIQETQICVDDYGNVKVWINSDLSINYPANDTFAAHRENDQEGMVDTIVSIVASNTDPETEPEQTFKQFFEQKRGKGKRFEEAKVLVLNYARLHDTEIPGRFEAILNMESDDHLELRSFTDHSVNNPHFQRREQPIFQPDERGGEYGYPINQNSNQIYPQQQQYINNNYQSAPIQNYSFGPHNPPQFIEPPPAGPHYVQQQQIYPPQPVPYYQPVHHPAAPVYYIPHYARIEYPARVNPNPNPSQLYPTPQPLPQPFPAQPLPQNEESIEPMPLQSRKSDTNGQRYAQESGIVRSEIKNGAIPNLSDQIVSQEVINNDEENYLHRAQEQQEQEEVQFIQQPVPSRSNQINNKTSGLVVGEADDLVARSLPIKTGYPSQVTQPLSSMGQSQRAIYSHINQKDQWQNNNNNEGFGLTKNSQLKLKDSALSSQKGALAGSKQKVKPTPIKYFYSLEEELEIDPDIAADMAKYLPRLD